MSTALCRYIIDGRENRGQPRPGLPSGKDCCKQPDPEQLVYFLSFYTNKILFTNLTFSFEFLFEPYHCLLFLIYMLLMQINAHLLQTEAFDVNSRF